MRIATILLTGFGIGFMINCIRRNQLTDRNLVIGGLVAIGCGVMLIVSHF